MGVTGLAKVAGAILLCLSVSATASAQYGGGSGGAGGTGMPGSGNQNYSYGNGKAIGIGVGAAAAAGVGIWLLVRHHHHAEAKAETAMTGCTEAVLNQLTLRNESDHQAYVLLANGVSVRPGERVELQGVVAKDGSGANAFRVRSLVNDYGGCAGGATAKARSTEAAKEEVAQGAK
jgi:hypothetical protein